MNDQLSEELAHRVRTLGKHIRHLHTNSPRPLGDWRMLHLLRHHYNEGTTPSAIAKHIGIALPTVSKTLVSLEDSGFIRRQDSKTDRRVTYIYITEQGITAMDENYKNFLDSFKKSTEKLGEKKTNLLLELVKEFEQCVISQLEEGSSSNK